MYHALIVRTLVRAAGETLCCGREMKTLTSQARLCRPPHKAGSPADLVLVGAGAGVLAGGCKLPRSVLAVKRACWQQAQLRRR